MSEIGSRLWVVAGGRIPFGSTGTEPEFTSRDELAILNASPRDGQLRITIYFSDREPVGPYLVRVAAQRVRRVRFNDLIDPQAMPLGVDYAVVIESNVPIVVQFTRHDTSQAAHAIATTLAFAVE